MVEPNNPYAAPTHMGETQQTDGMVDLPPADRKKIEAIINSMTLQERRNHKVLNGSRRLRIAQGSGTEVKDVNKFIKQFEEARKMMSKMMKMGLGRGGFPGMGGGGRMPF